ncbi:MAG: PAS domain-containing protein [bacterium]|nr:PAS domain-containing protein [bacterium]
MNDKLTDAQQEIKQLKALNLQLQTTLDHVGAYVFTKDREGRYSYANKMVCDLFGAPLEEVIGKKDEQFFDLEVSDELRKNDRLVLDRGESLETEETNVIATTGERRTYWSVKVPFFDEQGKITGMCGISTDITERLKLQRKVQEQKQLLDSILNNIEAHVYMKDATGRYLYVNDLTAQLYGCSQEEIVGKSDSDLMSVEEAEHFAQMDQKVLSSAKKAAGEETFVDASGELRHYWSIKIPLIQEGRVSALVGISTDVTSLVELQERLELANQTKDKFFSLISHDLRGPIGSLSIMFNEILSGGEVIPADMFETIKKTTKSTYHLLENLLSWARSQQGQLECRPLAFDLEHMCSQALAIAEVQARHKGIELNAQLMRNTFAFGDLGMLNTALRNLLNNAIKFTPNGGRVSLTQADLGDYWELSVTDTGRGLTPEQQGNLFALGKAHSEPGTDGEVGSGLGLVLCREFVTRNGGQLGVKSEPGQGTRFYFTLPKGEAPKTHEINTDAWLADLKILVVEDNPIHQESTKKALESYRLLGIATSGPGALEMAQRLGPDLILMDIDLPGYDGAQAAQKIRSQTPAKDPLLIFALTAYSKMELDARSLSDPFDGFLNKPLDPEALKTALVSLRLRP